MGMVACLASISPGEQERLRAEPDLIEGFLSPDGGEGEPEHYVELDKAWHGIHYLLTGDVDGGPEPLAWAVLGGDEVGEDVGYGPARFLTPQEVKQVASAIGSLSAEALVARYEPKAMAQAGVYPQVIWVREGQQALEYVLEYYQKLVAFYREAADRGDGAVLWIA
jgi:hypothetical protein